jgi:hypothetical protein
MPRPNRRQLNRSECIVGLEWTFLVRGRRALRRTNWYAEMYMYIIHVKSVYVYYPCEAHGALRIGHHDFVQVFITASPIQG